jgi:hypothetical protein
MSQPPYPPQQPYGQPEYGQPEYGQPQYGQPQYGAPPPGYGAPPPGYGAPPPGYGAPAAPRTGLRLGVPGLILALVGAALLLVSFLAVNWFTTANDSAFGGNAHFSDIHDHLGTIKAESQGLAEPTWIASAYFGWLGWLLLALTIVLAILANLPARGLSGLGRGLGLLAALVGIGLTFWAIKLLTLTSAASQLPGAERSQIDAFDSYSYYWNHVGIGFWLAVAGFVVAGVGAAIGARRAAAY